MKNESTQPAELDQLKSEVAALRRELAELKRFFSIEQPGADNGPALLHIHCSTLTLCDPTDPNRSQGMLAANEDGPALSLWGSDAKARVILSAKKDVASCDLLAKDLKTAVQLTVDEPSGRGQVGILEAGKPRALMKATDQGGVVSVVHDDGQVRALMLSSEHGGGEFLAVTPDMKTGVKITAGGPQGGVISVNRPNGKPGVLLACTNASGAVIVNDAQGQMLASLPSAPGTAP